MKKTVIILSLLVMVVAGCNPKQRKGTTTPSSRYGGIYVSGDTLKEGAANGKVCIYPENDSTLLFYVYTNNGAPSYNSGSIDGRIIVHDGKATFRKRFPFADSECVLHFGFSGDTLTVAEGENDCECGFGHGVYLDDVFLRTTSEIPQYYTTISNDTVWFSQWKEEEEVEEEGEEYVEEQDDENAYPEIGSRFTDYFPDLVLGQEHERGKLIPAEIVREFLPDQFDSEEGAQNEFYAVGKIMGYKGVNLFVFDNESKWANEDAYENHEEGLRFVILYDEDGSPVLISDRKDGEVRRVMIRMCSHGYGKWSDSHYRSYFDEDTTLVASLHDSVTVSATGAGAALISDEEYRWTINSSWEKELLEVTKLEYSSRLYDRNYVKEQNWSDSQGEGYDRVYPAKDEKWTQSCEEPLLNLTFHIERIEGELFPVFETTDREGKISDRYIVGKKHENKAADGREPVSMQIKCPVIIKTSDGDVELLPELGLFRL